MEKERLDLILLAKGIFASREKARGEIMAGNVYVNGERVDKPGTKFEMAVSIDIKENACPYVSRGGLKLKKAIDSFALDLKDKDAMDVGASTGGFTDCMLKHGANRVIAVDVGYGQLAWELRENPKVSTFERTNIKNLQPQNIPFKPNFVTVDVAFISLKKVLPQILLLSAENVELVCLIKPQFEAGREKVGKKGVVREIETHLQVVTDIVNLFKTSNISVLGLGYSPIKGPEGNIEFLIYGRADNGPHKIAQEDVENIVKIAHSELHSS